LKAALDKLITYNLKLTTIKHAFDKEFTGTN
jgi:hypothetical protein